MFSMLRSMSFDSSLMKQLFDCFLVGVILLLDNSMWQSLDSEVDVTATGLSVLSTAAGFRVHTATMVDGCSRFKVGSILASIIQIRLEYDSLR